MQRSRAGSLSGRAAVPRLGAAGSLIRAVVAAGSRAAVQTLRDEKGCALPKQGLLSSRGCGWVYPLGYQDWSGSSMNPGAQVAQPALREAAQGQNAALPEATESHSLSS